MLGPLPTTPASVCLFAEGGFSLSLSHTHTRTQTHIVLWGRQLHHLLHFDRSVEDKIKKEEAVESLNH